MKLPIYCMLVSALWCWMPQGASAQNNPFNPTLTTTNFGNRVVQFNINHQANNPTAFYLFDDGHYSTQLNVTHQYEFQGTFDAEVYALEAYRPDKPTKLNAQITTNTAGFGTNANPSLLGRPLSVSESWAPARDNEFFYIISFTNPCEDGSNGMDGEVEFHLDSDVNIKKVYNTRIDWTTPYTLSTSAEPGCDKKLTWQYNNLLPGEVRHVYVYVEVPATFNRKAVRRVGRIINDMHEDFDCIYTDYDQTRVRLFPHDPNAIEVNADCIKSGWDMGQEIEYTIYFHNEGSWFAEDILIELALGPKIVNSTIELVRSSFPCTVMETAYGGEIFFDDIFLPGIKQNSPHTYPYSKTCGFVTVSVCVEPGLDPGELMEGEAEIFFDALPGIKTNMVSTVAESSCPAMPYCDLSRIDPDGMEDSTVPSPFFVQIFPNPVQDRLEGTIAFPTASATYASIFLLDSNGMLIDQKQLPGAAGEKRNLSWNMENLPAGIYFIKTQVGDHWSIQKVVKLP